MSRNGKPYAAYARRLSPQALQKQKKRHAVKIRQAQTLLRQAIALIKGIEGHEELDMAKYGIAYSHSQMNRVTQWLDGTSKETPLPLEALEAELEEVHEKKELPVRSGGNI